MKTLLTLNFGYYLKSFIFQNLPSFPIVQYENTYLNPHFWDIVDLRCC